MCCIVLYNNGLVLHLRLSWRRWLCITFYDINMSLWDGQHFSSGGTMAPNGPPLGGATADSISCDSWPVSQGRSLLSQQPSAPDPFPCNDDTCKHIMFQQTHSYSLRIHHANISTHKHSVHFVTLQPQTSMDLNAFILSPLGSILCRRTLEVNREKSLYISIWRLFLMIWQKVMFIVYFVIWYCIMLLYQALVVDKMLWTWGGVNTSAGRCTSSCCGAALLSAPATPACSAPSFSAKPHLYRPLLDA